MTSAIQDKVLSTAQKVKVDLWLQTPKTALINGQWSTRVDGIATEAKDPATGRVIGRFVDSTAGDVDTAVKAARHAFSSWKKVPRRERASMLNKIANVIREHSAELATLEALNNGKLYREAYVDDLPESADVFDYYAGWVDKFYAENCPVDEGFLNYTRHEPLGVCGLIVPWNFPLLLAMWKIAPALAMGNTVVVKPSEYTSMSLIRAVELIIEADILPQGVLNLVLGGAEAGRALCEHPGVDKISFTGSTQTGKRIVQSAGVSNLKLLGLELGGKSANIVFDDVPDLQFAIARSFQAMFSHKGEKCSEPTRLFVQKKHYETFVSALKDLADKVICGNQFDERAEQGAQCHQAHFDKIMHYIDLGNKAGFRLVAGGKQDVAGTNSEGLFVRPTIFADVDNNHAIAKEEIFGPVLVVTPFSTEEEVIAMANDTIYGLAAGFWTSDVSRAHRVAAELDAGMVFINRYGCYDFASPFGGSKQSGWGKEMAVHSLHSYTKLKSVWVKI
ncbi:MAG: aldehyde dehydrogenase family protein [Candidatus Obscuribacterales bacterium]|nr:aldehyde dehydrogenase family protein [Candidatus Obscuribacterales bacterium]